MVRQLFLRVWEILTLGFIEYLGRRARCHPLPGSFPLFPLGDDVTHDVLSAFDFWTNHAPFLIFSGVS